MDIARINEILVDSLGEVDENRQALPGSEVFNFFVMSLALKTEKVHEHAAEMAELMKDWPSESWGQPVPSLGEEINYLTAGGVLGDQGRAFMLFAFGKALKWWDIMDPHTMIGLDYDNPLGQQMAGMGFVSIVGFHPETTV